MGIGKLHNTNHTIYVKILDGYPFLNPQPSYMLIQFSSYVFISYYFKDIVSVHSRNWLLYLTLDAVKCVIA